MAWMNEWMNEWIHTHTHTHTGITPHAGENVNSGHSGWECGHFLKHWICAYNCTPVCLFIFTQKPEYGCHLFLIFPNWKQSIHFSMGEKLNKLWHKLP